MEFEFTYTIGNESDVPTEVIEQLEKQMEGLDVHKKILLMSAILQEVAPTFKGLLKVLNADNTGKFVQSMVVNCRAVLTEDKGEEHDEAKATIN